MTHAPPESSADRTGPRRPAGSRQLWAFLRELVVVVVGAVVVASLLRLLVGQLFVIPSESMENTLQEQDRVAVEKLSHLQRGQVVVFADPGGWLTGTETPGRGRIGHALELVGVLPDTGTGHLIKRVVGMPGDHVVCCDAADRIRVNGQPLDERSYLYTAPDGSQAKPSAIRFDVVVPLGRMFVLGDNRDDSRDSRCHLDDVVPGTVRGENAFVAEDLVVGRAVAVVWPLSDRSRLRTPDTFRAVESAPEPAPALPVVHAGPEASC